MMWKVSPKARPRKVTLGLVTCAASLSFAALADSQLPPQPWGKDKAPKCVVCHSLERGGAFRSAPNLWGIVGAEKARYDWFGYSPALKQKGGRWTEEALDDYFKNPTAFAPGTKKTMAPIRDQQERRELIEFLKTLN